MMVGTKFRLGKVIGRGALGRVVLVHDDHNGKIYAGKILHKSRQNDDKARLRFISEAEVLASVNNENIVRVYGVEKIENELVMRMELIDGPSLAKHLAKEGPLAEEAIRLLALEITSGLGAAHLGGLIHRDLKPLNILITKEGVPKIADFGMARAASFVGIDESAFAVAGTPDYMAPECTDPLAVDSRSDLYSLGCILFEMAIGHPPFPAATSFAVLEAHCNSAIPPIQGKYSTVFKELVYELLAKSPADRPQSAAGVIRRLQSLEDTATALVLHSENALSKERNSFGSCRFCGQSLLPGISVCFGCGKKRLTLDDGGYSLFITGPGGIGDKLDSQLRQALLQWLLENPSLGLDPAPLAKHIPRVPFTLVSKKSQSSLRPLVDEFESMGLTCCLQKGGAYSLATIRKKSWILSGRLALIGTLTSVYTMRSMWEFMVPFVVCWSGASVGWQWYKSGKSLTIQLKTSEAKLLESVSSRLLRLPPIVANMKLKRHRDNLRGVVERTISLSRSLEADTGPHMEDDLAKLLDVSILATSRMDEIEVSIVDSDMRNPSEETLELMRERDRWAGRLLELTAFLDSIRARYAALKHKLSSPEDVEQLEELRAHILALEEVQEI